MRFSYEGEYIEFRGYVFAFGKPVTVSDKATEEALSKRSDFRRVEDEETKEDAIQDAPEKDALQVKDACPKCGKVVRQGRYMHVKYCKG